MISSSEFYAEYFGHAPRHLEVAHEELRRGNRRAIFLAGDSSLDNKYWFNDASEAVNGYERVLSGPMKQDIAYWLNVECV